MDIPYDEVCVKTEKVEEELLSIKKEVVDEDFSVETKMEFEYNELCPKLEPEPERLMGPSHKVLAEIQRNKVDPDAGCSFWNEQTDVNHSSDDSDEDYRKSDRSSVNNDEESRIYCDEKNSETFIFYSNPSSPDENVPPEFEKVFVHDIHLDEDVSASDEDPEEKINSNELLRADQEPKPGCSARSNNEVKLQRGRDLHFTTVNKKGSSHHDKDCSGEGTVQPKRNQEKNSTQQKGKYTAKTKKMKEKKTFICTLCDYKCSCYSKLDRHLRTHTDEKPFQCKICAKRFTHKFHLNDHKRTHTGEKPFQCTICSERFTQKSNLIRHKRTHTGEKPFVCTICTERFTQKSTLNKHSRTHTGEKPYQCSICTERFTQKSALNRHLSTHKGEKLFQCRICFKRFSRKFSLNNHHMRSHSGKKLVN